MNDMQTKADAQTGAESDGTKPQFLSGPDGQHLGVLLIHGFTGSPFELHLLARHVHAAGYHCALPLLAGHHDSLSTLSATRWPDWLASAEDALHALHRQIAATTDQAPRIAVVGLSMGGLLALDLARRYPPLLAAGTSTSGRPEIVALSTLATPLFLHARNQQAIRRLARLPGLRRLAVPKLFGGDIREAVRPRLPLKPLGMPIVCLDSLLDLMVHVRAGLSEVRQPALLMHGIHDHTVPYACLAELARSLGTAATQLRTCALPQSYHLLPLDLERQTVFAEVTAHLERYL